jgi:hypothetical protein
MGHPEDFSVEAFQRLVFNAVHWALDDDAPDAWAGRMPIDVPYEKPFKLRRGERVVMLGAGYVEQDANSSYLETLLTSRFFDSGVIFRSLGWPGDTVNVHMRPRNFGSIKDHVAAHRPSLVFVAYGMNEAFDGEAGLEPFREGYQTVLDMLSGDVGARAVLVSPTRHQSKDSPLRDAEALNENLRRYTEVVSQIAEQAELPFVNLFESLGESDSDVLAFSQDGSHLTPLGYWLAGIRAEQELGLEPPQWSVEIDVENSNVDAIGTAVSDLSASADGASFLASDARLPWPLPPGATSANEEELGRLAAQVLPPRRLSASGLQPGQYALHIDGKSVMSASAEEWAKGVMVAEGPEFEQVKRLRQEIVAKNRLFFYQWRAHNAEYIVGRRSGSRAEGVPGADSRYPSFRDEMARFDADISQHETEIARLAAPPPHKYELVRQGNEE